MANVKVEENSNNSSSYNTNYPHPTTTSATDISTANSNNIPPTNFTIINTNNAANNAYKSPVNDYVYQNQHSPRGDFSPQSNTRNDVDEHDDHDDDGEEEEEEEEEDHNDTTCATSTSATSTSTTITASNTITNTQTSTKVQKKKNRNRISFVCQACRKSKTRCDREKPKCTRCQKMGLACIYDEAKQPRPRIPNKDATIAKLEKDVSYWQNKAMKLLHQQQETVHSLKRTFSSVEVNNNNNNNINTPTNNNPIVNIGLENVSTISSPTSTAYSSTNNSRAGSTNSGRMTPHFSQKTRNVNNNDDDSLYDIEINLYKDHPTMIFSKVMKHDIKPLSENYIMIQDRYIAACVASAFMSQNSNSMIPALTANANISRAQKSVRNNVIKLKNVLMKQCTDPVRKNRIDDFTNRILENTNSSRNLKIGMILSMLYNTVGHQYLEDHCSSSNNYSPILKTFIEEFERLLPPFDIVQNYKKHFYQYVYPSLPFLQKEMFEESISQTLTRDDNDPTKVKLELGNNHLRDKIENLSILMVTLKLAYISLKSINNDDGDSNNDETATEVNTPESNDTNISSTSEFDNNKSNSTKNTKKNKTSKTKINKEKESYSPMPVFVTPEQATKYPISNDFILIAQRCLASENWFACANENIITCLLFIWSFFAFSPEEGDFFLEHPTDIISSLIMMLSTSIGLHRDPDDFAQLKEPSLSDQRLLNHRRLLWVAVVGICSFEATLKGRHPLLSSDLMSSFLNTKTPNSIKHYMERVTRDMTGSEHKYLLKIHEATAKRAQLSLLLSDLDNLTMSYNNTFSLRYLELSREKIEIFLAENFPLTELEKKRSKYSKAYYGDFNTHLNMVANGNSNSLQSILIAKLMFLRTSTAIFLHFEVKCLERPELLPYYFKYLIQTCADGLNLIKLFNDFFSDKYSNYLYKSNFYNVTKVIQLALPTALFTLIGVIIRLMLTNNVMYEEYQKNLNSISLERKAELNMRFEHTTFIQRELENVLEWMYAFASQNLRFTYFSIFKLFAVGDVVLQRIRNGEIWQGIFKIAHIKDVHKRIITNLKMTLGIDIEKGEELIEDLRKRNFIYQMPMTELSKLCREVHKTYNIIERPSAAPGKKQDVYIPPSVNFSLNPEVTYPTSSFNHNNNNTYTNTNTNANVNVNFNNIPAQHLPIYNPVQNTPVAYPPPQPNMASNIPVNHQYSQVRNSNPMDFNNNMQRLSSVASAPTNNIQPSVGSIGRNSNGNNSPNNNLENNGSNNMSTSVPNMYAYSRFPNPSYSMAGMNNTNLNNAFYNNPNMNIPNNYNQIPNVNNQNFNPNVNNGMNGNVVPNNTPNGSGENMASEFMERTKGSSISEQPEFFGGFDLFDYDFLFGNDFA